MGKIPCKLMLSFTSYFFWMFTFSNQCLDNWLLNFSLQVELQKTTCTIFFTCPKYSQLSNISSALHLLGGSFLHLGPEPVKSSCVLIIQVAAQHCDNGALFVLPMWHLTLLSIKLTFRMEISQFLTFFWLRI